MKIKILGGHGGLSKGFSTTSFLINDNFLIDAGSVAENLSISEQAKIDHILLSHSHLDHIKDLAFICDNCFGMKGKPFKVFTHQTVIKHLKDHFFNESIWPDFTQLPNLEKPTIELVAIEPEKTFELAGFKITPILVNHPNNAMGFILEDSSGAVLFTLDTGPTKRIWELARNYKNLKYIFTEVSFPNRLEKVAQVSFHHTPKSFQTELEKIPANIPIFLTHMKPNFKQELMLELNELKDPRISYLKEDGQEFIV